MQCGEDKRLANLWPVCKRWGRFARQNNRWGFQTEPGFSLLLMLCTAKLLARCLWMEEKKWTLKSLWLVVYLFSQESFCFTAFHLLMLINFTHFLVTYIPSHFIQFHRRCVLYRSKMVDCRTLILMQWNNSSHAVEVNDFRAESWDSCILCEGSITRHWRVNEHTKYTCTLTHVSTHGQTDTSTLTKLLYFFLSFFPSEQGCLVVGGGGQRGLATGAGQRNSGLFTFLLQPSLFRPFSPLSSVFLYSPHPHQLSVPLRGCWLCNERP